MKKITPSYAERQVLKELLRGEVVIKDEEGCLSEFVNLSLRPQLFHCRSSRAAEGIPPGLSVPPRICVGLSSSQPQGERASTPPG